MRIHASGSNVPVIGILFGTRDGSAISVCDSTDVLIEPAADNSKLEIVSSDIERRLRLWSTVYPSYKLLGWYCFGTELTAQHKQLNRPFESLATDSIIIIFDQAQINNINNVQTVPIQVYHATYRTDSANSISNADFVNILYKIDSPEVEKIAMDEIINSVPATADTPLENYNQKLLTSLTVMEYKIEKVVEKLHQYRNSFTTEDASTNPQHQQQKYDFLRNAALLCQSLERLEAAIVVDQLNQETAEKWTSMQLAVSTKTFSMVQELNILLGSLQHDREMPRMTRF
jgi:hypothetical protein